ncbi:MAG: molybdenum cofactor guanylyltransferase [Jiangellaceae bacterium]
MATILPHGQTGTDAAPHPHDHVDFAARSGGEVDMIMGERRATPAWAAVVLAGGRGRRLGGVDKPALLLGGRTLLDTALAACAEAAQTVVVGPTRPTQAMQPGRAVQWTQESPAGSGPLAALSAGVAELSADIAAVVVLAADLPAVDTATVERLLVALDGSNVDAVAVADGTGHVQSLLAAYRLPALRRALDTVGEVRGVPMRSLLDHVTLATIPNEGRAADDIDTPQDLARWIRRHVDSEVDHGEVEDPGDS